MLKNAKMHGEIKMKDEKITVPTELIAANRLLVFVLGIFIGLAVIVPGVSGAAVAMMLGLYTAMIYSIGNVFTDFKRCIRFLLPLILGALIGFVVGFFTIQKLFGNYLFEVVCLFVGFMIGALPAILRETKGEKITPLRFFLFAIGFLIPLAVGIGAILLTDGVGDGAFTDFPLWKYFAYFPLGILVSLTQIVPGLSATAILMAFGQFAPILASVKLSYVMDNPEVLILLSSLALGFAVGLVLISRLFSIILAHCKITAFFVISGMSVGSVASMLINPDTFSVYTALIDGTQIPTLPIIIGALLLSLGFVASFLLVRYEAKHREK